MMEAEFQGMRWLALRMEAEGREPRNEVSW